MTGVLTILGCGGSAGVPKIGNDWGACDPSEPRNYRSRASVLIRNGEDTIVIDTGADFRSQMNRENVTELSAVLYTHIHSDHVNGIDDLRAYRQRSAKPVPIYSTHENIIYLQARFDYMFHDLLPYYPTALTAHVWSPDDLYKPVRIGQTEFTVFEQDHEGLKTLGFRFGDIAYSTDMVTLGPRAVDVLKGIRTWVADGNNFYVEGDPGPHANKVNLDALNEQIGAETIYITHLKNNLDYRFLRRELPKGYKAAFDGLKITFDGTALNDRDDDPSYAGQ